jgi:putative endonuclease
LSTVGDGAAIVHRPRLRAHPATRLRQPAGQEVVAMAASAAARRALGDHGERVAVAQLTLAGMTILDRNWRCDLGEVDIVARDGDVLVICEVKTRRGLDYGSPSEAVTWRKASRLRRLAMRWLETHDCHPREVRVDVVAVLCPDRGPAEVEHLRGVC